MEPTDWQRERLQHARAALEDAAEALRGAGMKGLASDVEDIVWYVDDEMDIIGPVHEPDDQ